MAIFNVQGGIYELLACIMVMVVIPVSPCLGTRTLALMGLVRGRYIYQEDLDGLSSEACLHSVVPMGCLSSVVSPINVPLLSSLLSSYPDQRLATYVVSGVRAGFLVGVSKDVVVRPSSRNHPSCRSMPSVVGVTLPLNRLLVGCLVHGLLYILAQWDWSPRVMMV